MPVYPSVEALRVRRPGAPRVILLGDTQETAWVELILERNHHLRPRLLGEISDRAPDAVFHLGDLVTWGFSRAHWARLDAELAGLRGQGIPVFPVVGNHDRMLLRVAGLRALADRFPLLRSETYFSVEHAGVLFVGLDSNFGDLSAHRATAQQNFLREVLRDAEARSEIRAVVGLFHHPPLTNSTLVRPSRKARERFADVLAACPKTLAVFSGHCHSFEHFRSGDLDLFVTGGGGGPRQRLYTGASARYPDRFEGGALRFLHFCELKWQSEGLSLDVIRMESGAFRTDYCVALPFRTAPNPR